MRLWSVTTKAGVSSTTPSTWTRPAAIQRSASRREQRPARARRLAMRSGSLTCPRSFGGRGAEECLEQPGVALGDQELGMPLHADAEAVFRRLDALDHAVGGGGVDDHAVRRVGRRLVMGAVHLQLVGTDDLVQLRAARDGHGVTGLVARVG